MKKIITTLTRKMKSYLAKILQPLNFKLSKHAYQYVDMEISSLKKAYDVIFSNSAFKFNAQQRIPSITWDEKKATRHEYLNLSQILKEEGSDKSTRHSYAETYANILVNLFPEPTIVEVGIGSSVPSNIGFMGKGYKAGASLRAWKKYLPNARVIGADIDESTLSPQEGLILKKIDQTDLISLVDFAKFLGPLSCDLIIDDGLHNPLAAVYTFKSLWGCVKPGGYYVIEDMSAPMKSFYSDLVLLFDDVTHEFKDLSNDRARITNCLSVYRKK